MKKVANQTGELRADLAFSRLVRDIEQAIGNGSLKPGDRLPSEVQLKKKYGISINSIRRGMDVLTRQGLLSRRRGSGTYVSKVREAAPVPRQSQVILLANLIEHLPTHPFFGARKRALIARLAELGWRVESFVKESWGSAGEQRPVVWHHSHLPHLLSQIESGARQFNGIIADRSSVGPLTEALKSRLPIVCLAPTHRCPFVEYDWEDELSRAITLAIGPQTKTAWLIGGSAPEDPALARIKKDCNTRGVTLINTFIKPGVHSRTMHETCEAVRDGFRRRRKIDALIMESDIHAQGVFDALENQDPATVSRLRLVALVNKESRLHTALPYTALVADGAAAGSQLADLLHIAITDPEQAPASIYLRCSIRLAKGWPRLLSTALP